MGARVPSKVVPIPGNAPDAVARFDIYPAEFSSYPHLKFMKGAVAETVRETLGSAIVRAATNPSQER